MQKEIRDFTNKNNLSVFEKTNVRSSQYNIFQTKDAKEINQKVLSLISNNFVFNDTKQILKLFSFTSNSEEIKKRQKFFKNIETFENSDLKKIKKEKPSWKPEYDVVGITEDESTLVKLKEIGCPIVFINQQSDLINLDRYDLIQAIHCDNFGNSLERLPQTLSIDSLDEAYLERFLIKLSEWINNIELLKSIKKTDNLNSILNELMPLLDFLKSQKSTKMDLAFLESELARINEKVISKIKEMTLSGETVVSLLTEGIPKEIQEVIEKEISSSGISRELFLDGVPLKFDEKEVNSYLKNQATRDYMNIAASIKKNSDKIKKIPSLLKDLETELIYQDFISGVKSFFCPNCSFPEISTNLDLVNSLNLLIENPQPISFRLDNENRCSILTGANSGGKTTLIEHIIQLISLFQLGFPVSGQLEIPLFTDVYYFAKNKGSMSKGAFETLLTKMSDIQPGEKTLILADEIEAVTEPGVAGEIIVSTAEYFLEKNCFLVIATHLGQEVQHLLPEKCRLDGIEAKGLTENYELIVDHNPVLGKLANSTPELIIEKMAKAQQKDYFIWLFKNLKKRKD